MLLHDAVSASRISIANIRHRSQNAVAGMWTSPRRPAQIRAGAVLVAKASRRRDLHPFADACGRRSLGQRRIDHMPRAAFELAAWRGNKARTVRASDLSAHGRHVARLPIAPSTVGLIFRLGVVPRSASEALVSARSSARWIRAGRKPEAT